MKFDIVIIGASSSGLYAARLLAEAGKCVAVFERQNSVEPARRTYIITPHIKQFLGEIPGQAELCQTQVMSVKTGGAGVDIVLRQPDLIIERCLLTQALLKQARAAGAEVFTGYRFLRFLEAGSQTKLVFETDGAETKVCADFVIGADGLNGQAAKAAGIPRPPSVPIIQAEIDLPRGWDPKVTRVWFDVKDTRFFYWLIPESSDRAVLGLVGENAQDARQLLDRFLAKLGLKALKYQHSQVALHHPRQRPWGKVGAVPVYLVGDAAGQVKVTTVGGTVTGFWGAQAAVEAIIKETSYAQALRPLKRELDLHWYIRYLLEKLDNPGYDRLVNCITPPVKEFLSKRNRDQMAGGFWQLPLREPRLLLLGIRLLFKLPTAPPRDHSRHLQNSRQVFDTKKKR